MEPDRKRLFSRVRRMVVKVGSNLLTKESGLDIARLTAISQQICRLIDDGLEVVLVSSGAMAAGLRKLGLSRRPDGIPQRQAVAAVGQAGLIMEYEKAFEDCGKKVAQVLLTGDGLHQRKRYLNARNTLHTLMAWHIVPIINENDTVSVEEIKFGDNDTLSAMIALLLNADVLVNLSDIDGLYDRDPRTFPDARLIPVVTAIGKEIERYASDIPGALGTGGMMSKIRAARKVTAAGIPMIIARGARPNILLDLVAGKPCGTFFIPKPEKMGNRKSWIGFTAKPSGTLWLDDGAVRAILKNGKSLLPAGIVRVSGEFGVGAAVECRDASDAVLGVGLVNYSAADIRRIQGLKTSDILKKLGENPYDEVIHRNNLTVTDAAGR